MSAQDQLLASNLSGPRRVSASALAVAALLGLLIFLIGTPLIGLVVSSLSNRNASYRPRHQDKPDEEPE